LFNISATPAEMLVDGKKPDRLRGIKKSHFYRRFLTKALYQCLYDFALASLLSKSS